VVFGLGGGGYALGNLLLARALPHAEFVVFTLFLALTCAGIGAPAAWFGARWGLRGLMDGVTRP